MNRADALDYLRRNHRGVLATLKADGRPHLTHVGYMLDNDDVIKISVTWDRVKTRNARRDPRVSLSVIGPNWYEYLVAEGTAHLVEEDPIPLLRRVYVAVAGKDHPDWQEFDEAMRRDGRLVLAISIDRLYPLT